MSAVYSIRIVRLYYVLHAVKRITIRRAGGQHETIEASKDRTIVHMNAYKLPQNAKVVDK